MHFAGIIEKHWRYSAARGGPGIGWYRIGFSITCIVAPPPLLVAVKSHLPLPRALLEIKFLRALLVSLRLLKGPT